jgi:hypothetical protein
LLLFEIAANFGTLAIDGAALVHVALLLQLQFADVELKCIFHLLAIKICAHGALGAGGAEP